MFVNSFGKGDHVYAPWKRIHIVIVRICGTEFGCVSAASPSYFLGHMTKEDLCRKCPWLKRKACI